MEENPKIGDIRIIEYFAWFPIKFYNEKLNFLDKRWFQVVKVKQKYVSVIKGVENVKAINEWFSIEFVK